MEKKNRTATVSMARKMEERTARRQKQKYFHIRLQDIHQRKITSLLLASDTLSRHTTLSLLLTHQQAHNSQSSRHTIEPQHFQAQEAPTLTVITEGRGTAGNEHSIPKQLLAQQTHYVLGRWRSVWRG